MICRKKVGKKAFVKTPSLSSISKLMERVNDRASYKDSAVTNLAERLTNVTAEKLFEKNIVYHKDYYSEIANVEKFERDKKCYSDSIEYGDSSVIKRFRKRPLLLDQRIPSLTERCVPFANVLVVY